MLLSGTLALQETSEKVEACGPRSEQGWLCRTVFDVTDNQRAAEIADAFAVPVRILVTIIVAYLAVRLSRFVIRRLVNRLLREETAQRISRFRRRTGLAMLDTSPMPQVRRAQRTETLSVIMRSIASVVIWTIAVFAILDALGVNAAALVAGAGVIGVAIGFGAQNLVRDFLNGIFIVLEDQYGVGDVIDAGPAIGTVEGVSLRTTRLRDVSGIVWHIPNGQIMRVGNQSQQWSRALLDIPVAPSADVTKAIGLIKAAADDLAQDSKFRGAVLAEPEVWGVDDIAIDKIVLRVVIKTRPLEQWRVARELRGRVLRSFAMSGIPPQGSDEEGETDQ
jgi:moderate conductance mechanosensitive channel